jgi:nucleoside-diphosphate-sugar epimerase
MSKTFLVTGSSGYLGSHLTCHLLSLGHKVISLGSSVSGTKNIPWRLGQNLNHLNLDQVDAIFHLAHIWNDKDDINFKGTMILLEAFRKSSCKKFVFASSISSKRDTSSSYGLQKWKIEQKLNNSNEISVRIGLVYGGKPSGLWKSILNIIKFFPFLPMINPDLKVQPVHVLELNNGLISLAEKPHLTKNIYTLGLSKPISFSSFLKIVSIAKFNRNILVFKISHKLIFKIIKFVNFFGLNIKKDRLEGMLNLPTIDNSSDLVELGVLVSNPYINNINIVRKLFDESSAFFAYIGVKSKLLIAQSAYVESVKKFQNGYPLFLPSSFFIFFSFIPILEPVNNKNILINTFISRLRLAYFIAETLPSQGSLFYDYKGTSKIRIFILFILIFISEILFFPFRILISWLR